MVINVHTREFAASPSHTSILIDNLASPDDKLWPYETWPPMYLNRSLSVGAAGSHGPIRYAVEEYEPGRYVRFKFTAPKGFEGTHAFDLEETKPGLIRIRHVIDMRVKGSACIIWPLAIRWLHDALIEDAFDRAEAYFRSCPVKHRKWSLWVCVLRRVRRKLFRSMEMAYRALSLPVKNEAGLHDFGSSFALWVSSIEILAHTKGGNVDKTIVFDLLRKAVWHEPNLRRKYFRVSGKGKTLSAALILRLYDSLYKARNAFLHGNPIHADHWRYKGRMTETSLGNIAPVIYRTAIMSYLGWLPPILTTDPYERIMQRACDHVYEDFLMQLMRRPASIPTYFDTR